MGRLAFTVPNDVEELVGKMAQESGRPVASILREALEQYLIAKGYKDIETDVQWGGNRKTGDDGNSDK